MAWQVEVQSPRVEPRGDAEAFVCVLVATDPAFPSIPPVERTYEHRLDRFAITQAQLQALVDAEKTAFLTFLTNAEIIDPTAIT